MIDPWFNPNQWAWLPGTLFGCLGGLWGTMAGILVPRGKARRLVLGLGLGIIVGSVVMLAAGLTAFRVGQPHGVWYALILPGVQGVCVLGPLLPIIVNGYRKAEARRMEAEDLLR